MTDGSDRWPCRQLLHHPDQPLAGRALACLDQRITIANPLLDRLVLKGYRIMMKGE